jgi:GMP synthase-like glutamine amidotransferase
VILFVDTEHESGYLQPWGEKLQAARTRIKYRLEDLTGDEVLLVRYDRVDHDLVERVAARAMFLSGSSATVDTYGDERDGVHSLIRDMSMPMFGFCGGLQMMATALDIPVAKIGVDEEGDDVAERGYQPTPITAGHAVFEGLSDAPVMRHSHSWELKTMPDGFGLYSSTEVSPIQLIIHDDLPVVGTQFHPEYWTAEAPEGRLLIENFCRHAGLIEGPADESGQSSDFERRSR